MEGVLGCGGGARLDEISASLNDEEDGVDIS